MTKGLAGNGGTSTTTFFYDDAGVLQSSVDGVGNSTGPSSAHTTTYSYDPTDTYVTQVNAPSTNGISHVTKTDYDPYTGAVIRTDDENSVANGQSYSTTYHYDSYGRPHDEVRADGGTTVYSYPSTTETDTIVSINPSTSITAQSFLDAYGRSSSTVSNGVTSSVTYDVNGRVHCRTHPAYSGSSTTDGSECVDYDGIDRVTTLTHQPSGAQVHSYFSGNAVTTLDEVGNAHAYYTDAFGRLSTVVEQGNIQTAYTYNLLDQLTHVDQKGDQLSNPSAWRTRWWNYDAQGRLIAKYAPESGTTCYGSLDGNGNCQESYDANGNLLHSRDNKGNRFTYAYDELNRLTGIAGTGVYNCGGCSETHSYYYDAVPSGSSYVTGNARGRLVTATNETSGSYRATNFNYDPMGRITVQTTCLALDCNSLSNPINASYDQIGNIATLKYPDGRTLQNSYDSGNRLQSVNYIEWAGQGISGTPAYWSSPSYKPTGQISAAQYGNGVQLAADYGNLGQITSLGYSSSGLGSIWQRGYQWDGNGKNLLVASNPAANVERRFTYDPYLRLTSAIDYSTLGTPGTGTATVNGAEGYHEMCPDDGGEGFAAKGTSSAKTSGGATTNSLPGGCVMVANGGTLYLTVNGFTAVSAWGPFANTSAILAADLASQLNSASSPVTASVPSGGSTITLTSKITGASTNYSISWYNMGDGAGNFNDFTISLSGSNLIGGTDGGSPLVNAMNESYSYDYWGNLKKSGNYTFQPSGFTVGNQVADTGYQYDGNGSLTSDPLGHSYGYNYFNQLVSATNGASSGAYAYDGQGNRVSISLNGGASTEYVYFGGRLLATRDGGGNWRDYLYAGNTVFAEVDGNQWASADYRLTDNLGSIVGMVNGGGSSLGTSDYFTDGKTFTSSLSNPFGFTGLKYDGEPDSAHADNRDLFAVQGRWLTGDPFDGSYDLANPQSLNRYSYVNGAMTQFTDQSGLAPCNAAGGEGCGPCKNPISCIISIGGLLCHWLCGGNPAGVFVGTLERRPSTGGIWDEKLPGGVIIQNPGIVGALGVPSIQCKFGVCNAGTQFLGPGDEPADAVNASNFIVGLYLTYQTFKEMERANVRKSDKYYHCKAMAAASSLGDGGKGAAYTVSWGREITDTFKYQYYRLSGNPKGMTLKDSIADSKDDLHADYVGIRGGYNACNQFKVRGIP